MLPCLLFPGFKLFVANPLSRSVAAWQSAFMSSIPPSVGSDSELSKVWASSFYALGKIVTRERLLPVTSPMMSYLF